MKFLYINNELCADCNRCSAICPTSAVYSSGNKKYINYDMCVSCGNCFRECVHNAISVEKIERIAREIDHIDELRGRIKQLEQENSRYRDEVAGLSSGFQLLLDKLPVPVVVTGLNGTIRFANGEYAELTGFTATDMEGMPLRDSVSDSVYNFYMNATLGDDIDDYITEMNGRFVSFTAFAVPKRELIVGIFRDLDAPQVANAETIRRIKASIDKQMSMVQKIGFLLGEEVSEIAQNLNSVIKIIDRPHGK